MFLTVMREIVALLGELYRRRLGHVFHT